MTPESLPGTCAICYSFPEQIAPNVIRENLLDTIDTIFNGNVELVLIDGEEGIGKTCLLQQFAIRHADSCISLFVRSAARMAYSPELIRFDLANQAHFLLHGTELDAADQSAVELEPLLLGLQRRARTKNKLFYFVIDGIADIPKERKFLIEQILDYVPFGMPHFRILMSDTNVKLFQDRAHALRLSKSVVVPGFALSETAQYLENLVSDRASLEEIHRTCRRGNPGALASVRRLLLGGHSVQALLDELPALQPDLFQIEWRKVDESSEKLLLALAVLAFDRKKRTVQEFAHIVDMDVRSLEQSIEQLSFLNIDRNSNEVDYVSEAFRRYAQGRLQNLSTDAHNAIIDSILQRPSSEEALLSLPLHLESAGRLNDLLSHLTPEHFSTILERSQSLSALQQHAAKGLHAARKLEQDGELLRFSMHKATILGLDRIPVLRSELEARMALDNDESALALVTSSLVKADRLHLLSAIAKIKFERGLVPEPEIVSQIKNLYEQIDITNLGKRAIDIASDLIYADAKLAIDLVEKASHSNKEMAAPDWAMAMLSASAMTLFKVEAGKPDSKVSLETLKQRIKDPSAQRFTDEVSLMLGDKTASQVIQQIEKIGSVGDQLYLLRRWALKNKRRQDAVEVVEYGLRVSLQSLQFTTTPTVLLELCSPLPYIEDHERLRRLINIVDGQRPELERLGPTDDFIDLQLLIAAAELKSDAASARNRFADIYLRVSEFRDASTALSCLAKLVAVLTEVDPHKSLEEEHKLHSSTLRELEQKIDLLLTTTADHFEFAQPVVTVLAGVRPDLAFALAKRLNTQCRRDLLCIELLNAYSREPMSKFDPGFAQQVLAYIDNEMDRQSALSQVLNNLFSETPAAEHIDKTLPLINLAANSPSPATRAIYCSLAYRHLSKRGRERYEPLRRHLLSVLEKSWRAIDTEWDRVNIGFQIARDIAEFDRQQAREYLSSSEQCRQALAIHSRETADTYVANLLLALRAYEGLLPSRLDEPHDLDALSELINHIGSSAQRVLIWGELALACHFSGRRELVTNVVQNFLLPVLAQLQSSDNLLYNRVVILVSPALFFFHKTTAIDRVMSLLEVPRNAAISSIVIAILTKKSTIEPFEESIAPSGLRLSYEESVDICELVEKSSDDGLIDKHLGDLADSLHKHAMQCTREQRADLIRRMQNIVDTKLPSRSGKYIAHEGYKIVGQARLLRLDSGAAWSRWEDLIARAEQIPNMSDRSFVLGRIAANLHSRFFDRAAGILAKAMACVELIPSEFDRKDRYEALASAAVSYDRQLFVTCLQKAMAFLSKRTDSDSADSRNELIDLAYRVDPKYAQALAAISDDDPVKAKAREAMQLRLKQLEYKDHLVKHSASMRDIRKNLRWLPEMAWSLLGALNAGRINTPDKHRIRDLIESASHLSLKESYPVFAFAIESANQRYAKTQEAPRLLRPIFDSVLLSARLAMKMADRSGKSPSYRLRHTARSPQEGSLFVRSGERELALSFLREWIRNNVKSYLKICDPYFGPEELSLIQLVSSVIPDCSIHVLTSLKHHQREQIRPPWDEAYQSFWRLQVSDQEPPPTQLVIVGTATGGDLPIHDRWWLTDGAGLRIGTSLNSLGIGRDSEVVKMTPAEAAEREAEIDRYLAMREREYRGDRLKYNSFNLSLL